MGGVEKSVLREELLTPVIASLPHWRETQAGGWLETYTLGSVGKRAMDPSPPSSNIQR